MLVYFQKHCNLSFEKHKSSGDTLSNPRPRHPVYYLNGPLFDYDKSTMLKLHFSFFDSLPCCTNMDFYIPPPSPLGPPGNLYVFSILAFFDYVK